MRILRNCSLLLAFAVPLPTACHAQAGGSVTYEKVSVPFDGMRMQDNPVKPYWAVFTLLRGKAAAEAREAGFEPVVDMNPVGLKGERNLISAVTPTRGVFYYVEAGPYPAGPGPAVIKRRSQIEVCRVTVRWDKLPGGGYAPGTGWAGATGVFPESGCERPAPASQPPKVDEWRRRSASATYAIVASGAEGGLKGAIVTERWPRGLENATHPPFDGGRAVAAVVGRNDRVVRAIPLLVDGAFYAETAAGRAFAGLPDRLGGDPSCIVEGLRWADLASSDRQRRLAASALCDRLFHEYVATLAPRPGEPGPQVIPFPPR